MAVQTQAWEHVGERFETLGDHLRGHFDDVSADAAAERAAFEKSIRGLLAALEDGFNVAGKAVRDPILRQDVMSVATAVREALLATFETAGEQVRERLTRPAPATRPVAKRAAPAHKPATRKVTARKVAARKTTARKTTARKRSAS
jgi:hypothetical protein